MKCGWYILAARPVAGVAAGGVCIFDFVDDVAWETLEIFIWPLLLQYLLYFKCILIFIHFYDDMEIILWHYEVFAFLFLIFIHCRLMEVTILSLMQ